jgi:hypothetical protein
MEHYGARMKEERRKKTEIRKGKQNRKVESYKDRNSCGDKRTSRATWKKEI